MKRRDFITLLGGAAAWPLATRAELVVRPNRPGGNVTGVNFFTVELVAKRMQLLRELMPGARRVAVLVNQTDPEGTDSA